jgi:uncharacterized repeat protein (TIGR03806 family)
MAACDRQPAVVVVHPADQIPERLSDWGIVFADGNSLELHESVIPYDLNTPLFSDYALKLRTVWVPEGKTVGYNNSRELDFPVGTIISKTFHYEKAATFATTSLSVLAADRESNLDDDGQLDLSDHFLVETRLLIHYADGWQALPYVWNAEQNEAFLELAGEVVDIELVTAESSQNITYIVPDANQCAGCHVPDHDAKALRPIGPRAWQLNRDKQLQNWAAQGLLSGLNEEPPHGVRWSRPGQATVEQRAKAYLDANCAHCHNPDGAADTSALNLEIDAPVDRRYGVCKTPVAVGRGSGDRPYDISPGKPGESILLYRMQHSDPAIAMPELGRSVVHSEGVAVISEWIAAMNGDC